MWKRTDVRPGTEYRVRLHQEDSLRSLELVEIGSASEHATNELMSAPVPVALLVRGDVDTIAKSVPLTSGERFYVDAHGIWLTQAELDALEDDDDDMVVPWVYGVAPRFPPK